MPLLKKKVGQVADNKTLYDRLPEIYRIKDTEQIPSYPLKAYIDLVDQNVFEKIRKNIEELYHNQFIETCDDWVVPYIGDLLGTTHLQGDAWTLRADVADTITLRRRKGTLGAIERLTFDLTKWGVHAAELFKNLSWAQHLNHQRPDRGGNPPYGVDMPKADQPKTVFGGTLALKDPAMLSLLNTPFDPYAHAPDLKKAGFGQLRYNLPNLAIFLWRLIDYTLPITRPLFDHEYNYSYEDVELGTTYNVTALCFHVDPCGHVLPLFNAHDYDAEAANIKVTALDDMPGPIHPARLTSGSASGNPDAYVHIETYNPSDWTQDNLFQKDIGLQLHFPNPPFTATDQWSIYGADLTCWENSLPKLLKPYEIAIDPKLGRIILPILTSEEQTGLKDHLLLSCTYGAVGPVGSHPISRESVQETIAVNYHEDKDGLQKALDGIQAAAEPISIEIKDSMVHELDLTGLDGTIVQDGGVNLQLKHSLTIRAASGERPVIKLAQPLRFRPTYIVSLQPVGSEEFETEQALYESLMKKLNVRLEGLYIARGDTFPANQPLIARAGLNRLEIVNTTLDPGGQLQADGTRAEGLLSLKLKKGQGFTGDEHKYFSEIPEIVLSRSITGGLQIDSDYELFITDSIIDGSKGVNDTLHGNTKDFAITSATKPLEEWGPPTTLSNATFFGSMRVEKCSGRGGIWVHPLLVFNDQTGCIKLSYFPEKGNRLPQNHACVFSDEADLRFTAEAVNQAGYGQLSFLADYQIREQGPNEDWMGAFNFILEAHKWRNIKIRYREFMPVGIRPLLIPVT